MADAGVPENFIPKILNHVEPGVTRRHYNLHAYRGEKRAALETWARYLEAILTNKQPARCGCCADGSNGRIDPHVLSS
jgi:hypothetical protein